MLHKGLYHFTQVQMVETACHLGAGLLEESFAWPFM